MGKNKKSRVVLCILDGWGEAPPGRGNAIRNGKRPVFDKLEKEYPPIYINASSVHVGLPEGQMGNSEVGHLNIGAGRVVLQSLPRINSAIKDGSFFSNGVIDQGVKLAIERGSGYHLIGLLSDGGVHSHIEHIKGFLQKARDAGLKKVFLHPLMDGRDTPPESGAEYMKQLIGMTQSIGIGRIATVGGRYYAMDRDKRWDRVKAGFDAIVHGISEKRYEDPVEAISASYGEGVTDEFILPSVITDPDGTPTGSMKDGDVVQFFNFRADRIRQIALAITDSGFSEFERGDMPSVDAFCLTEYDETFNLPVAFDSSPPKNNLGEYMSKLGLKQFRTAETEKYAHVTFFFNGGVEAKYPGEVRKLIQSPKVATYDLQPEMSAPAVCGGVVEAIESDDYDLIVVNFANGDMVGHTGIYSAAIKAVETINESVGKIINAIEKSGAWLIVTADHGNIENMIGKSDEPITAHSTNRVPLYVVGSRKVELRSDGGALCDIAPTILELIGLDQPEEMTGRSLLESKP